jgi:hypothetical protein
MTNTNVPPPALTLIAGEIGTMPLEERARAALDHLVREARGNQAVIKAALGAAMAVAAGEAFDLTNCDIAKIVNDTITLIAAWKAQA